MNAGGMMNAGSRSRHAAVAWGRSGLAGLLTLAQVGWLGALGTGSARAADGLAKGPVKVFILAGQSNMDGQAQIRTIDFLGEDPDPAVAGLLKIFKPDGTNYMTRDDVWVGSGDHCFTNLRVGHGGRRGRNPDNWKRLGGNIGPEYAFGYTMGEAFDEQVLLIKHAPGGQSLYANFRPPSAGVPDGMNPEAVGNQYRALVSGVQNTLANLKEHYPDYDEEAGYEIVGLVWFQGFNDMISGGKPVAEYGSNLKHLINDLRKEFKAPDMKVVVGVLGVNGPRNEGGKQGDARDQMRSMNDIPEFKGNVRAIETAPLLHPDVVAIRTAGWLNRDRDLKTDPITAEEQAMLTRATSDKGFHYYGEGRFFILLGKVFADTMLELSGMGDKVVPPTVNHHTPPAK